MCKQYSPVLVTCRQLRVWDQGSQVKPECLKCWDDDVFHTSVLLSLTSLSVLVLLWFFWIISSTRRGVNTTWDEHEAFAQTQTQRSAGSCLSLVQRGVLGPLVVGALWDEGQRGKGPFINEERCSERSECVQRLEEWDEVSGRRVEKGRAAQSNRWTTVNIWLFIWSCVRSSEGTTLFSESKHLWQWAQLGTVFITWKPLT